MQIAVSLLQLVALGVGSAQVERRPLLVAVEVAPNLGCDAAEVRKAIHDELGVSIAGPVDSAGPETADALIVGMDRSRIAMSLRASADSVVARTIAMPADPSERLRAVAWLAGNLARDQVAPIVAGLPEEVSPPPTVPETPPSTPKVVAVTEPLPAVASSAATQPRPNGDWTVTGAWGPALPMNTQQFRDWRYDARPWQLEVHHRGGKGRIWGAALDGMPRSVYVLGAAVLVGSAWERGDWSFDLTVGAGVDAVRTMVSETMVINSSETGTSAATIVKTGTTASPYLRGFASAGYRIVEPLDVVVRIGSHLSALGFDFSYLAGTVGLRLRLP